MSKLHILLLAAGASKRMKQPKQLLDWGDNTLLQHQIKVLQPLKTPISVVLGANSAIIKNSLNSFENVNILENPNWKNGLGNSIAFGVQNVLKNSKNIEGILIVLADQPLVTIQHYQKIIQNFNPENQQIILSKSPSGFTSPPVLFDSFYFSMLQQLDGDTGAMPIVKTHQNQVTAILCENLEDIDTPEQYEKLKEKLNRQS